MYLRATLALVIALFASPLWACNPVGMIGRSYSYVQQSPVQTYAVPAQQYQQIQADPGPTCSTPAQSLAPAQTYYAPQQTCAAPVQSFAQPYAAPRLFNPGYVQRSFGVGYGQQAVFVNRGLPLRVGVHAAATTAAILTSPRVNVNVGRGLFRPRVAVQVH